MSRYSIKVWVFFGIRNKTFWMKIVCLVFQHFFKYNFCSSETLDFKIDFNLLINVETSRYDHELVIWLKYKIQHRRFTRKPLGEVMEVWNCSLFTGKISYWDTFVGEMISMLERWYPWKLFLGQFLISSKN